MSETIRQILTGAGSILELYPEPYSLISDNVLPDRGSVEDVLRGDMRRVEHDFRRAFDRVTSHANVHEARPEITRR